MTYVYSTINNVDLLRKYQSEIYVKILCELPLCTGITVSDTPKTFSLTILGIRRYIRCPKILSPFWY